MAAAIGVEERAFVASRLYADTRLYSAHVPPGLDLDLEASYRTYLAELAPYVAGSNERQVLYPSTSWICARLFPPRFTLGLADGRQVAVDRTTEAPAPARKTEGCGLAEPRQAYIRVPSFGRPDFGQDAVAPVRRFASAGSIVIDVRGNGGGSTPQHLIAALMDRPYRTEGYTTPAFRAVSEAFRAYGEPDVPPPQAAAPPERHQPAPGAYRGKLAFPIDGACFSACENLPIPFKDNHRATLVGEQTLGSSGMPFVHAFPNGMGYRISAKRETLPTR